MATTTQNIIKNKYGELIRLISLIGDYVDIEDKAQNSLILHIYKDKKELLTFRINKGSLTSNSIDVLWKISDSFGYNKLTSFPDSYSQKNMFKKLITQITEWQHQVSISKLSESAVEALNIEEKINKTFAKDWPLFAFCAEFGPTVQLGEFKNHTTGKPFTKCRFINGDGNITYANFYSRLGSLTAEELIKRKDKLFVGLRIMDGEEKYYIHGKDIVDFEIIDLGFSEEKPEEYSKEDPPDLSFTNGHYGVDYLSINQKYALLGEITHLYSSSQVLQTKEKEVNEILDKFMDILRLNYLDIKNPLFHQFKYNKDVCDETIKTIEMDGPFILLIVHCMQLIELDESESIIKEFYNTLIDIGYTGEEALTICNCDFVFRFDKDE